MNLANLPNFPGLLVFLSAKWRQRGKGFREHGQNQRGVGSKVGGGDGWGRGSGGGEMETTLLEQQ